MNGVLWENGTFSVGSGTRSSRKKAWDQMKQTEQRERAFVDCWMPVNTKSKNGGHGETSGDDERDEIRNEGIEWNMSKP